MLGLLLFVSPNFLAFLLIETVEDKPVDQMAAEEVADEEIDESAVENRDADDEVSNRGPEEEPFSDTKPENSEPVRNKNNDQVIYSRIPQYLTNLSCQELVSTFLARRAIRETILILKN